MDTWQHPLALLHLALPLLCILGFGRSAPERGLAWCMVAGTATYQVLLLVTLLVLGHLEVLFPPYYTAVVGTAAAIALIFALLSIPAWFRALKAIRYRPKFVDLIILTSIALFLRMTWWEIRADWTEGATTFDSLAYHIPRVMMWSWHGNFHPYPTAIWHQIGYVVGGSGTMLPLALMGRGWLGAAWTGLVMAWASMAAVFVIGRAYKLSVRSALLGALVLGACPVVGMRMSDITTDITAAFPVLAGVALFLTLPKLHKGIFLFVTLSAVGVASKQYVAFPVILLSLVLFLPRAKEILFSPKNMVALLGGVAIAAVTCLLSFYPIYEGFGTITGGNEAKVLIAWNHGWPEMRRVTTKMFFNWMLEPLSVFHLLERLHYVPQDYSQRLFDALGLGLVYTHPSLSNHDVWYPIFTPFNNRSGLLPFILLPWLIMAVRPGRRLLVTGLFIALYISQTSILVTNYWAARFVIIMLGAYALLWAARAEKNPVIVSLFVLLGIFAEYQYIGVYRRDYIPYTPQREHMSAAAEFVKPGEKMSILSVALSQDAFWVGRLGQYQFQYVICPADGDWVKFFNNLKSETRWFLLPGNGEDFRTGPSYESRVSHICPIEKMSSLREFLKQAGWRYKVQLPGLNELWTSDPNV